MGHGQSCDRTPTPQEFLFMARALGISYEQVQTIFNEFNRSSRDGKMNKREFRGFYARMHQHGCCHHSKRQTKRIADKMFKYFDRDGNGCLGFIEYMNGVIMMESQGQIQPREKFDFVLGSMYGGGSVPPYITYQDLDGLLYGLDDIYKCQSHDVIISQMQSRGYTTEIPTQDLIEIISASDYAGPMSGYANISSSDLSD